MNQAKTLYNLYLWIKSNLSSKTVWIKTKLTDTKKYWSKKERILTAVLGILHTIAKEKQRLFTLEKLANVISLLR